MTKEIGETGPKFVPTLHGLKIQDDGLMHELPSKTPLVPPKDTRALQAYTKKKRNDTMTSSVFPSIISLSTPVVLLVVNMKDHLSAKGEKVTESNLSPYNEIHPGNLVKGDQQ